MMVNSFSIGPITIYYYAIFVMLGIAFVYFFSNYFIKKAGYKKDVADDLFIGGVIFGLIAGRLWYVLFYPDISVYLSDPFSIIAIWDGGIAIQGGVIGVSLFFYFYCKKHNYSFLRIADIVLPSALIGQAIGRWGNFFNQEAYGTVVDESFFNFIPSFIKDGMFIGGSYRMPMFLLESIANVIAFILIYTLFKKFVIKKRGDYMYSYLLFAGVIRFVIEIFRTDNLLFFGLKSAQVTSVLYIIVALLGFLGIIDKIFKVKKATVVFDLDGTLANTKPEIYKTFNKLMKKYNDREMTRDELDSVFGPSLEGSFKKYFPNQDHESLLKEYQEINIELQKKELEEMPHALEVVTYVKELGHPVAILSNKNHDGILLSLDFCGLDKLFDVVLGFDDLKNPKPDKEGLLIACDLLNSSKDNLIYVGDSVGDMYTARNAGAYGIGLVDPIREEDMKASNPNRLIHDLNELPEILKENKIWTYNLM